MIYIKKINYYNSSIIKNPNSSHIYKYNKYLYKYLSGGGNNLDSCKISNCSISYDNTRTPSNCDRILYKGRHITTNNYGVYGGIQMNNDLIRLSDHLLVYGSFTYKTKDGNKPCILFTWNVGKNHNEPELRCGIGRLIKDFNLFSQKSENNYEFIIFCLQESGINDLFPQILIEYFKQFLPIYKVSSTISESINPNFNVRLIVFHKSIGIDINTIPINNKYNYNNILLSTIVPKKINVEPRLLKSLSFTKTALSLTIDGLTIVSCHLPLDVKNHTENNYLGNNLRIEALNKIKSIYKDEKNIIIAGDLNFRRVNNKDQLTEYLSNQQDNFSLIEFTPELTERTCKLKTC